MSAIVYLFRVLTKVCTCSSGESDTSDGDDDNSDDSDKDSSDEEHQVKRQKVLPILTVIHNEEKIKNFKNTAFALGSHAPK